MTLSLPLLLQAADIGSNVVVDGAVDPGALAFLLVSWAFVLGLMAWAFAKILRVQAHRSAALDGSDGMGAHERVPPTA